MKRPRDSERPAAPAAKKVRNVDLNPSLKGLFRD